MWNHYDEQCSWQTASYGTYNATIYVTIHRGKEFQNHRSRLNVITDADANVSFDDSEIPDYQTISYD